MNYTTQQRQEAYKKLPPEVQTFVMSEETTDIVANILNNNGLIGEQSEMAESQVLYALVGLQTLSTSIDNISSFINKASGDIQKLKNDLEEKVFSKYKEFDIDINDFVSQTEHIEQKNLEIRPDIHPMIEKGGVAHDNPIHPLDIPKVTEPEAKQTGQGPQTTTYIESTKPEPQKTNHYPDGVDPYREPIN